MVKLKADIVVIGGGIAGLWLHRRLNDLGYYAILLDRAGLGGGQTLSSQGIIHGGSKYTLSGMMTASASAISAMPDRWQRCMEAEGEIDLSGVGVLSANQFMWSTETLSSKLTSFFGSKAVNGNIQQLSPKHYPLAFQSEQFNGSLYRLNEAVVDVPSLVEQLSGKWRQRMLQLPQDYEFERNAQGLVIGLKVADKLQISASQLVLTSGEGNQSLLAKLSMDKPKMQCRPLHMILAKGKNLPSIYAHCIGASAKPLATITTHYHSDGDPVWYIGGKLAEDCVDTGADDLIAEAQTTLAKLLPWVDLNNVSWATHKINRAEPAQSNLLRPDTAYVYSVGNVHIAWPTKLALAPDLVDRFEIKLTEQNIQPDEGLNHRQIDQAMPAEFTTTQAENLWERSFHGVC
jgi:glycerol-3-phosphate dehydrogenase